MFKQYPVNFIGITQGFSESHQSIDLGWYETPDMEIYSCGDGYVERIYTSIDGGNVVRIKYDDNTSTEFMNLKNNSIVVKVGDRVSRAQKVAIMGDTGYATGVHLHLILRDSNGNRVNPIDYLYAYPNQTVSSKDKDIIMRYNPSDITYIVQKGDTLSSIAEKYNTTWQDIYELNKDVIGDNPNLIYPGQIFVIPNSEIVTYTVQKGDTLSSIAEKYNTTWQKIYEQNKDVIGDNPNLIYPGQVLIIK